MANKDAPERKATSVGAITPQTLLDYPGKMAAIFWFRHCNMRCPYCYNRSLLQPGPTLPRREIIAFLDRRKAFLDGVVFSGGECTAADDFESLAHAVKERNYALKIDTNGTFPDKLDRLVREQSIDALALDFKAPLHAFAPFGGDDHAARWRRSLQILLEHPEIVFEVRTTFDSQLLTEDDLSDMAAFLYAEGYRNTFYIQNFFNGAEPFCADEPARRKVDIAAIHAPLKICVRNA